jgi:NAD(P)-dependent dehydrogenase (short-subunit alcohol dehydrogenase family)
MGRAFAIDLAKAGAKAVVNARTASDVSNVVEEIRKMGGTAEGCAVSVASMEGAREIVQTAVDGFGRIDSGHLPCPDVLQHPGYTKTVKPFPNCSRSRTDYL